MHDNDLRELFSEWARPLLATEPPAMSVIRRRRRRRTAGIVASTVAALVAVVVLAVIFVPSRSGGHQTPIPAVSQNPLPGSLLAGRLPAPGARASAAPYYVVVASIAGGGSEADVWSAATGKKLGSVAAPTVKL